MNKQEYPHCSLTCYRYQMNSLSRKDFALLALLTLTWGINWPIMKIGVQYFPALSFRALSMIGGLAAIWLATRYQKVSLRVPKEQIIPIIKLAIPNMLIWHVFMILGVKLLSSGRAATLGYTMPVWAVLAGFLFFRERINGRALIGILLALSGALLLLSSEFSKVSGQPIGTVFALIAAASWGCGTVMMKRSNINIPTISLTFWMLAFTSCMMSLIALTMDHASLRLPTAIEWAAITYNAVIVFGFAHVAWFRLARILPPVASSLSVMFIPVLGVFAGMAMLGEVPHWQDYTAILLILAAMSTVLFKSKAS